jgi:hypothetical protein
MSVGIAVCTEYERLQEECQGALNTWNEGRAQIYESRWIGKESDDKLRQLQAKYAKASWKVRNHEQTCELCQMISRFGGRHFEEDSCAYPDHRLWA